MGGEFAKISDRFLEVPSPVSRPGLGTEQPRLLLWMTPLSTWQPGTDRQLLSLTINIIIKQHNKNSWTTRNVNISGAGKVLVTCHIVKTWAVLER